MSNKNKLPICERGVCQWNYAFDQKTTPEGKAFKQCQVCRLIFYQGASPSQYETDYFFSEYQNQYGKSYLEDKAAIQTRMRWRLELIQRHLPSSSKVKDKIPPPRLLEIGSACGFFLELVQESGFLAEGWEISSSMAKIANEKNLTTQTGDFASLYDTWYKMWSGKLEKLTNNEDEDKEKYDVLAGFYVIEHFSEPLLFWEAARNLLKPNGLLVLSLPSASGPLFLFHKHKWMATHPEDHFVDYSLRSLEVIGKTYGFKRLSIQAEGIHPERIPMGKLPVFKNLYRIYQRSFAFSDTLLVIFRRLSTH